MNTVHEACTPLPNQVCKNRLKCSKTAEQWFLVFYSWKNNFKSGIHNEIHLQCST